MIPENRSQGILPKKEGKEGGKRRKGRTMPPRGLKREAMSEEDD